MIAWTEVGNMLHYERGARKAKLCEFPMSKWSLYLSYSPRIHPSLEYDVCVKWSTRLCPDLDKAIKKAEEVIDQEWA